MTFEIEAENQFTFCKVEDIQFMPASGKLVRQFYDIPDKYEPIKIIEHKIRQNRRPDNIGKTSNMTRLQYFEMLLMKNEINACNAKAVTQDIIFRYLRKEFPSWAATAADSFFTKIAKFRHAYNTGELYLHQRTPILFSFYYNDDGYICHKIRRKDMLSFPFCRGELTVRKFADPRFFTPEEIAALRKKVDAGVESAMKWIIPVESEIRLLEKELGKPLYDAVTFADGYGKNSKIL
jgi:hypothetical protein